MRQHRKTIWLPDGDGGKIPVKFRLAINGWVMVFGVNDSVVIREEERGRWTVRKLRDPRVLATASTLRAAAEFSLIEHVKSRAGAVESAKLKIAAAQGAEAATRGRPLADNPYPPASALSGAWHDAWQGVAS
jgi:hypothetical protein